MDLGEPLARGVLGPQERDLGPPVRREQAHELPARVPGRPEHRDAGLLRHAHKYAHHG